MISFTDFRKRNYFEAEEPVAAPAAETPDLSAINAEIDKVVDNFYRDLEDNLYGVVVPNRVGTGFGAGLRRFWWNLIYGDQNTNPNHPMYNPNIGGRGLRPGRDEEEKEAALATAKKESVQLSKVRLIAEWSRVVDEMESEASVLLQERVGAGSWDQIWRTLLSLKTNFVYRLKNLVAKYFRGRVAAPTPPSTPLGEPKPASASAVPPPGKSAVEPLEKPGFTPPPAPGSGPAPLSPPPAPGSGGTPPVDPEASAAVVSGAHAPRTSRRPSDEIPRDLMGDRGGILPSLKGHLHSELYKKYEDAYKAAKDAGKNIDDAIAAGSGAVRQSLDQLKTGRLKNLVLSYKWYPPGMKDIFEHKQSRDLFFDTAVFYIRKELGENPGVPASVKKLGYHGDGVTMYNPKPTLPKNPAIGSTAPGTAVSPLTPPAPASPPVPGKPATPASPPAPPGTTPVPGKPSTPASPPAPTAKTVGEADRQLADLEKAFKSVNWEELLTSIHEDKHDKAVVSHFIDVDGEEGIKKQLLSAIEKGGVLDPDELKTDKLASIVFDEPSADPAKKIEGAIKNLKDLFGFKKEDDFARVLDVLNHFQRMKPNKDDGGGGGGGSPPVSPPSVPPVPGAGGSTPPVDEHTQKVDALKKASAYYDVLEDNQKKIADMLIDTAVRHNLGLSGDDVDAALLNVIGKQRDTSEEEINKMVSDPEKVKELAKAAPTPTPTASTETPPAPTPTASTETPPTPTASTPAAPPLPTDKKPEPAVDPKTIPVAAHSDPAKNLELVNKWRDTNPGIYKDFVKKYSEKYGKGFETSMGGEILNTILTNYSNWDAEDVRQVMDYIMSKSDDQSELEDWNNTKPSDEATTSIPRAYDKVKGNNVELKPTYNVTASGGNVEKPQKKKASPQQKYYHYFVKNKDWMSSSTVPENAFISYLDSIEDDDEKSFSNHYEYLTAPASSGGENKPIDRARKEIVGLVKQYAQTGEKPPGLKTVTEAEHRVAGKEEIGKLSSMYNSLFKDNRGSDNWKSKTSMSSKTFVDRLDTIDNDEVLSGHYRFLTTPQDDGGKGMSDVNARTEVMKKVKEYVKGGKKPTESNTTIIPASWTGAANSQGQGKDEFGGYEKQIRRSAKSRSRKSLDDEEDTYGGHDSYDDDEDDIEDHVDHLRNKLRNREINEAITRPDRKVMSAMKINERVDYLRSLLRARA